MSSKPSTQPGLSRRDFLKTSSLAAGSLVIACHLPVRSARGAEDSTQPWVANAFVSISTDNKITVLVNHEEMGQGVYTALPMLVAEELDADWTGIVVEPAPVTPEYHHAMLGFRLTGGSSSVSSSWQRLRTAGATARALLITAAAQTWNVDPSSLSTKDSHVIHDASGRRASYGSLVAKAATLDAPQEVKLKDPKDFRVIGTDVKRVEGLDKVTGKARFSIDIRLPDMLTAVVAHAPVYGDKVKSYRADEALSTPGVTKVKQISSGVAVIAKDFWTAKTARDKLAIEWSDGPAAGLSTATVQQRFRELVEQPGPVAESVGDLDAVAGNAAKMVEGVYELPYLAHACMETLNCTAQVKRDSCELWLGTQTQSDDQIIAAEILGIEPDRVKVNGTLMGGGFGRRLNKASGIVAEAVEIARGEKVPIRTVWTREEDMQGCDYRPMFTHKVTAWLDEEGMPVAWLQRLAGQSIYKGHRRFEKVFVKNGIDYGGLGGVTEMPYGVANRRIELHSPEVPIPIHWWRSICWSINAFVSESFIDEVAHAGGKDPVALRRTLLKDKPRHLGVLNLAAEKAGWGEPLAKGRARGVAVQDFIGTCVAQVAEVSLTKSNDIKVERVTCAVDCGIAVNPSNVRAQIEGSIIFGLSAALYGEITIENGRVQQSNFDDYPVLRMDEVPEIAVHIVDSGEAPKGIGEPGVPPIAPAVTNALFSLTGKRVRKLPIRL
jgi:isoquinoline 1-oxidoreductase beta subunit